jgi:hypothetical protein
MSLVDIPEDKLNVCKKIITYWDSINWENVISDQIANMSITKAHDRKKSNYNTYVKIRMRQVSAFKDDIKHADIIKEWKSIDSDIRKNWKPEALLKNRHIRNKYYELFKKIIENAFKSEYGRLILTPTGFLAMNVIVKHYKPLLKLLESEFFKIVVENMSIDIPIIFLSNEQVEFLSQTLISGIEESSTRETIINNMVIV